jgi:hypothetical protein
MDRLRKHLGWMDTPPGALQALKERLADAERELQRPTEEVSERARIEQEIQELRRQIDVQERVLADPRAASQRTEERIASGLERERQPEDRPSEGRRAKFINPPPLLAPTWFQDRHVETGQIGDYLKEDGLRLMTVVGRGGVGKTAMVCRLLKALESGQLPDEGGPLAVDGIVYLSPVGAHKVSYPNLFVDLTRLLPDDTAKALEQLYQDPQQTTEDQMLALLEAFPDGRTVLLLDNFEDVIDPASEPFAITDAALDAALQTVLTAPQHGVKLILTTRVAPGSLLRVQPARQRRLTLDEGLGSPYAENILKKMDPDATLGLKTAPAELLAAARERTGGYPRALEALVAILNTDRDTSLPELLAETASLPGDVVQALVGEAFNRLDPLAQQVMQALCRLWPSISCSSPPWWRSTAPRCWVGWSTCSSYAAMPVATTCIRSTVSMHSIASRRGSRTTAISFTFLSPAMRCGTAVQSISSRLAHRANPGSSWTTWRRSWLSSNSDTRARSTTPPALCFWISTWSICSCGGITG